MSAAKHTPGPWYVMEPTGCVVHDDGDVHGLLVADLDPSWTVQGRGRMLANARLIAAAPELLNELQLAHRIIAVLLNMVPPEGRAEMADRLAKVHDGEGSVRARERLAIAGALGGQS